MKNIINFVVAFLFVTSAHAQDWSKPDLASSKSQFMTEIHDLANQCIRQDLTGATNIPTSAMRYNRTNDFWEEYNGSTWSTAPISGSAIVVGSIPLSKQADIATDRLLGRDSNSTGPLETLTVGGGLEFTGAGGIQRAPLTGDVTAPAGSTTTTIGSSKVTGTMIIDNTITSADILNGEVAAVDLASGSVDTSKIVDLNVTGAKLANDTIPESKLHEDAATRSTLVGSWTVNRSSGATGLEASRLGSVGYTTVVVMPKAAKLTHLSMASTAALASGQFQAQIMVNGVLAGSVITLPTGAFKVHGAFSTTAIAAGSHVSIMTAGTYSPSPLLVAIDLWGHFTE